MKLLGLIVAIAVIWIVVQVSRGDGVAPSSAPTAASVTKIPADVALRYEAAQKLSITKMTWTVGGFGSVPLVNVTIKNANDFSVSDVELVCDFYAQSGTRLASREQVIYRKFPAGKSTTVKEVNMGLVNQQMASANCSVGRVQRVM